MGFLLHGDMLGFMEKKLTNSGPFREPADKHSIYAMYTARTRRPPARRRPPGCGRRTAFPHGRVSLVSRTRLTMPRSSLPRDDAMAMCGEAHPARLVLRTDPCNDTAGGAKDELGPHQPGFAGLVA